MQSNAIDKMLKPILPDFKNQLINSVWIKKRQAHLRMLPWIGLPLHLRLNFDIKGIGFEAHPGLETPSGTDNQNLSGCIQAVRFYLENLA